MSTEISSGTAELLWLESQTDAMRELVESVCNENSGTLNEGGVSRVRDRFKAEFAEIADQIREVPVPDAETVTDRGVCTTQPIADALFVSRRKEAQRKVFLCIHLDTVYPVDSSFQVCQEVAPGTLNGPGVIDAKGGAVVMLFALRALERSPLADRIGWEVVLNTDEEIGSPSSEKLIKEIGKTCDFGLLYEPALADGTLVDARKGSGNFSIVIRGRSVHSGREFEKGRNAIVAAAEVAANLHRLNEVHQGVTINVARIDGGGPFNVVPDVAVLRVNARVEDAEQQAWFERELARQVMDIDGRDGFSSELHGAFFSPPKVLDAGLEHLKSEVARTAQTLDIPVAWRSTGGVSDGNKLAAVGIPNIDTMGARGGEIHSEQEFLLVDSLVERAKLSAAMLLRYAANEFSLD